MDEDTRHRAFFIKLMMASPQMKDLHICKVEEHEALGSEINELSFENMSVTDQAQSSWPSPLTTPSPSSAGSPSSKREDSANYVNHKISDNPSIIQYQDQREQLNSQLQLVWTENISTGSNLLPLYEKVAVLLISWACDDLDTADEVFDCDTLLPHFN